MKFASFRRGEEQKLLVKIENNIVKISQRENFFAEKFDSSYVNRDIYV